MLRNPIETIEQENGAIKIYGNNQPRDLLPWEDLTEEEQNDFTDLMGYPEEDTFIRYKGQITPLGDFVCINPDAPFYGHGYDGYSPDSFFSGLLIKLVEDCNQVKVYTYIG